ncbi:unnamed protein product [Dicrocoelium dendriticum]|nr:unnamed protein product [Dicrocoelium dendriticum]
MQRTRSLERPVATETACKIVELWGRPTVLIDYDATRMMAQTLPPSLHGSLEYLPTSDVDTEVKYDQQFTVKISSHPQYSLPQRPASVGPKFQPYRGHFKHPVKQSQTYFIYPQPSFHEESATSPYGMDTKGDSGASSTSTAHLRSKSTPEIEHFPSLRYPIDSGQSSPLDVTFSSNYYEKYESREYTERIRSCLSPSVPQPVDQPWKRRHDFKLSSAERSEHWLQRPPLNRSCPEYLASDSAETISRPLYVRSSPLRSTKDDAGVTTSQPLTRERKLADKLQDSYDTSIQSPETERQEEHRFKAEEQTFMHLTHFDSIVKYPSWQGHRDHHVRQDTETPELRPFYRRGKASSVPVDTFFAPEPYKIRHRDVEASHVKEMPEVPSVGITEHLSISSERVQRSVSVNDTEKVRKPRVMRRKSDLDQYIEEQIDRVYREELARRESQTLFQKAKGIEGESSSDLSVLASREERRRPLDNEMQKRVSKKLSKEASDEGKQPEHDRLTAPRGPMSMENQRWPPAVPVRRESLWKVSPKRSKEDTEFRSQVDEFQTPFKKPEAPEKISESPGVAATIGVHHTPRRIPEKTSELGSVVGQATDHPKEQTPRQEQQDVRTGEVRDARESSYKTMQDRQKQPDRQKYSVGKHPSHEYDNKKHRQPQSADQTNLESPSKDTFRLEREKSMEDTLVKVPRPTADEEEKRPESATGDYSETKKSRLLSIDKLREDPRITEHKAVPEVAKRIHLQRWMPKPTERHSVDEEVTVNRPHLKTADQTGSRIRPQELAVEVQHPIDGGLEDKVRTPWVGRDRIKAQPLQRHVLRETHLDQDDRLSRVNVRKPDGKATEGTTERLERRNIEKRDSDQKLRAKEDKPLKTPLDKPLGATHQGRWSSYAGERPQSRHIESQPASFHQFRQDPLSLAPEQSAEEENHSGYRALAAACLRPLQEIVCPTKIERSDVTGKKDSKSVAKDDRRTDDRHGSHRDSISAKVRKMGEYDQRKSMTLPLVGSVGHMTETPMERKRGAVSKQSHADRERKRSFDMPRRDSVFHQEGGKNVPISQFDHFGHRRHVDNGKDSDKERTVSRPISTGPCPKDKEQKRVVKLRREPSSDSSAPRRDHLRSSASQKTSTAKGAPDDERHQRTSPPMDDSPPGHVTSLQKSSDVRKDKHGEGTCSMSSASPYGLSRPTPAKRDGSSRRTTQQDEKPLLTDRSAELTSPKPLGHKRHPPPPTSPPYQRPHRTTPERMIGNGLSQPPVNGTGDSVLYPTQRSSQDDDRLRFQFEQRDSVGTSDSVVQGDLDATIPSGEPDEYNLVDEAARQWHSSEYGDAPPDEHAGTTVGSSRTLPKVPRGPSKLDDEASENSGEPGHRQHPSQHYAVPRSREALSEDPTTKQEKHESRSKDRRRRGEARLPTDTATHVPDERAPMEDARHRDRKMRNGEDSDSHKHRGSYDRPPSSRMEKHDSVSDKGSAHGHRRRHPPPPKASDRSQHPARNGHQGERRSSGRRHQTVIHDDDDEYVNWPAFRRPNGEEGVEDYGQWPHELSDRSNERSTYDPRVTVDEPVQPPAKNVPKHRRAENGLRTDHRSRKSPPTLEPQPAVRHHPREPGRRGTGEEKDETYEDDDDDLGDSHDDDEELRPPPLRSIPQSKQSSDSLARQPTTPTPPVQFRHPRRGSLLSPGALSLPEYSTPGGISGRSHGGSRGNYRPEQVHPPKVADHERISRPRHKHDTVTSDRRGVSGEHVNLSVCIFRSKTHAKEETQVKRSAKH